MRKISDCKYRDTACCAGLGIFAIVLCLLLCGTERVFGSKVDWISQHSVIADYFRQQFYDTGELFPEFAANIGGGQNIYNFSYYGLYNPIILFSYLLPFIKMGDYLMGASIVVLAAAVMVFYCWLRGRGFSGMCCFFTAAMFLLAGPMIFHSYNHVMFVNYMPFLCMGFWGIDRYFQKKKGALFTVSVFLMIMTSFYFSICGMLVLVLYGLHRYFQVERELGNKVTISGFFKAGMGFGMHMLGAVMMSGILLVPTALALTGRNGAKGSVSLAELFCPTAEVFRFVYSGYGIGLTTLVITVLITGLTYKRLHERVLAYGAVIILMVPVFAWALNGGLYIRDKVLIPFLPLLCYMTADYLKKLEKKEISFWQGFFPYVLTLGFLYLGRDSAGNPQYWGLLMADGLVMLGCFLLFYWKRKVFLLSIPPVVFLLAFAGVYHRSADRMLDREFYEQITEEEIGEAVEKVLEEDDGFYRMEQLGTGSENAANLNRIWNTGQYVSSVYSSSYNGDYQNFRQNVFEADESLRNFLMQPVSRNPLFQKFMGINYLITDGEEERAAGDGAGEEIPGYELYETIGNVQICCNNNVSPIAYGTDRIISEDVYEGLEFPYNQLAFMSYGVTENGDGEKREYEISLESAAGEVCPADLDFPELDETGKLIEKTDRGYHVTMKKKEAVTVGVRGNTEREADRQILFLQFQVKNKEPSRDVGIWVEKEKNTLCADSHIYYNGNTTFTYAVLLKPGQSRVELDFGKGDYEILDIHSYLYPWSEKTVRQDSRNLYQSEFHPDKSRTKGKRIVGNIEMKKDGYFITTIPYDTGFQVLVDGEEASYEKVNTAFLGFPMKAGTHNIEIIYHAPGVTAGKILSGMGALLFLGMLLISKRKR